MLHSKAKPLIIHAFSTPLKPDLRNLTSFSPPRKADTVIDEDLKFPGIQNNCPHENVFPVKLLVGRTNIPGVGNYLTIEATAQNGFSVKVPFPVKKIKDAYFGELMSKAAKCTAVALFHNNNFYSVVLDRPLEVKTKDIDFTRMQSTENERRRAVYEIRSLVKKPDEVDPDIYRGFIPLFARFPEISATSKSVFAYLDPDTVRSFGRSGSFSNMPFVKLLHPQLADRGFPTEHYTVIGQWGKIEKIPYNCLSNMKINIPLRKVTAHEVADPSLPLKGMDCLNSVPTPLWRKFIDTVFLNQFVDSLEGLELGKSEASPVGEPRSRRVATESTQELGEIYDGPRDSLRVKGQFVLFEVSLKSGQKIFLADSPLYGRALHAFRSQAKAEEYIANYGRGQSDHLEQAFCINHFKDWRSRFNQRIAAME